MTQPDPVYVFREDYNALMDLLAVIHGDGGQETERLGIKQACNNAADHVHYLADLELASPRAAFYNFVEWVRTHKVWSTNTFGPGKRTKGILQHIAKECAEVATEPTSLKEWGDIIVLAVDGAIRAGHSPEAVMRALCEIQRTNQSRKWKDWRELGEDAAVEHVRTPEEEARKAAEKGAF